MVKARHSQAMADGSERNGLQKAQERLPIAEARKQLMSLVKAHQTLVLVGETGSGKSTQLPQFLHRAGLAEVGSADGHPSCRPPCSSSASPNASDLTQKRF
jgi:HrpA-like RNA helicase